MQRVTEKEQTARLGRRALQKQKKKKASVKAEAFGNDESVGAAAAG
jgi:hypothetical protein